MCLPIGVFLCQHIEEKGVHIIVQGLVVQEQLGQQAQALAVHLQHAWVYQSSSTKGQLPSAASCQGSSRQETICRLCRQPGYVMLLPELDELTRHLEPLHAQSFVAQLRDAANLPGKDATCGAAHLVGPATDLKDRNGRLAVGGRLGLMGRSVNLISGGMRVLALGHVPNKRLLLAKVFQAEFAYMQLLHAGVWLRVGRVVPCVHLHTKKISVMTLRILHKSQY